MTATIVLYKDTLITPERSFVVDSIDDYLDSITTKKTISDFQFQRFNLEMEIKLDLSQSYQEFKDDYNYNYCSITNGNTGRKVYYFIVKKRQIAESTMGFTLLMDTANTFKWNVDFTPTARTKVTREHKNRLQYVIPSLLVMSFRGIDYENTLATDNTFYNGSFHFRDNGFDYYYPCQFQVRISGIRYTLGVSFPSIEDRRKIINYRKSTTALFIGFTADDPTYYFEFDEDVLLSTLLNNCIVVRNIDYYSEGINPVLYKKELGLLTEKANTSWNLIYRNAQNDDDAIACYILPDEDINAIHTADNTLTYNDFEDGKTYTIAPFVASVVNHNGWPDITPKQKVILLDNDDVQWVAQQIGNWATQNNIEWNCIALKRVGTKLYIKSLYYSLGTWYLNQGMIFYKLNQGEWKEITSVTYSDLAEVYFYKGDDIPPKSDLTIRYFPVSNGSFSETPQYIDLGTLQDVDRVDPKLVKIIKIPYFPTNYEFDEEEHAIVYDSTWSYVSNLQGKYDALQLNDLNTRFSASIVSEVTNPLSYNLVDLRGFTPSLTDTRDDYFESKLFHSDFYQVKFVYDSFSFPFALERISVDEFVFSVTSHFEFTFVMTSTINSKFMFVFPQYVLRMSTEDYDNVLPVARNNEAPIYNSSYITYLRTAYRYDLKELGQKQSRLKAELGLNEWRTGVSVMENAKKKDFTSILTGLATFGVSVFTSIQDLQRNEWTLEAKLEQLKNQSASVSGSDDLDLMEAYANNKAKLVEYQCSPRMRELLADLFYYFGYTTNELKIPQLNTRVWFNYIACELELQDTGKNLSQDIVENLKERYNNGLTILHKVNGTWNFAQDKENWEAELL